MSGENTVKTEAVDERGQDFRQSHQTEDWDDYFNKKHAAVERGEPTWVLVSPEAPFGGVYQFYYEGKRVGYIEEDDQHRCDVYIRRMLLDWPREVDLVINQRPLLLGESVEILEKLFVE